MAALLRTLMVPSITWCIITASFPSFIHFFFLSCHLFLCYLGRPSVKGRFNDDSQVVDYLVASVKPRGSGWGKPGNANLRLFQTFHVAYATILVSCHFGIEKMQWIKRLFCLLALCKLYVISNNTQICNQCWRYLWKHWICPKGRYSGSISFKILAWPFIVKIDSNRWLDSPNYFPLTVSIIGDYWKLLYFSLVTYWPVLNIPTSRPLSIRRMTSVFLILWYFYVHFTF